MTNGWVSGWVDRGGLMDGCADDCTAATKMDE